MTRETRADAVSEFRRDLTRVAYMLNLTGIARGSKAWAKEFECLKQKIKEHLNG